MALNINDGVIVMLKRWNVLLLALILALSSVSALAEPEVRDVAARDIRVSRMTDVLIIQEEDSEYYKLITADGQDLTDAIYSDIQAASSNPFFKAKVAGSADGVHCEGLLDLQGNTVIPTEYADVEIFSDRWQVGIRLVPSDADTKDYTFTNYSTDEKSFYKIDTVDFYFDGQMVGTLNRSEYGDNYATPYGAYICVEDRSGQKAFYNSRMEKSDYEVEYSGEYDSQYKNGKTIYYHQGSGQVAFVPECTLQPDEVDNPYVYERGILYGLQGQEIFKPAQNYDNIREFNHGYAMVSMNGYYGVIDEQGNEVIPVEYDEVSYNLPVQYGYVGVAKDGKFGYVDLQGNVTCDFTYSKEVVSDKGTFATITNLDGTTIVLSAAAGELPEHYSETQFPGYEGCMAFVAVNQNGEKGVVDLYGNTLIPFSEDNSYIDINSDATVGVVYLGSRQYRVYRFDGQGVAPAAGNGGEEAPAPAGKEEAAQDVNDGDDQTNSIISRVNDHAASAEEPACPACGYVFEDGKTPKFCPNCGAAQE